MPDSAGRPTMADGLALFQGLRIIDSDNQQRAAAAKQQEAYTAADVMAQGGDLSKFDPEVKYKGAELHWKGLLDQNKSKTQEFLLSQAGQQDKMGKIELNNKVLMQRYNQANALLKAGMKDEAMKLMVQTNNENMFTGRNVEIDKDGYNVKNLVDGSELKVPIEDMPPEKALEMIGGYIGMGPDELVKHSLTAEQYRQERNADKMAQAVPWEGKNGQIIYKVPAGTTDPVNGSSRPAFFVDAAGNQVPGDGKGFKPLEVASKQADIGSKRAAAAANYAQAEKTRRPDVVDPNKLVPGPEGQAGLVTTDRTGKAQYAPVEGGLQMPQQAENPSEASSRYNLMVKQMDTELTPFVEKGKMVLDPDTLEMTNDGKNALQTAVKLVMQAKQDPGSLSEEQRQLVPNAQRAVQMYQAISEKNAQSFGLQSGQQRQVGGVTPPPPAGAIIRGQK